MASGLFCCPVLAAKKGKLPIGISGGAGRDPTFLEMARADNRRCCPDLGRSAAILAAAVPAGSRRYGPKLGQYPTGEKGAKETDEHDGAGNEGPAR